MHILAGITAAISAAACSRLLAGGPQTNGPGERMLLFHRAIADGNLESAPELFSFEAAYAYWRDVTASLGIKCGEFGEFKGEVMALFTQPEVRMEAAGYTPGELREKILGRVASVVFDRQPATGPAEAAVASMIFDGGQWKVRTYPGVFPGRMLGEAKRSAAEARGKGRLST